LRIYASVGLQIFEALSQGVAFIQPLRQTLFTAVSAVSQALLLRAGTPGPSPPMVP
jgi:hypothetical protein